MQSILFASDDCPASAEDRPDSADAELFLNTKRVDGEPVGDAGDIYVGFDRFGRACDIRWQTSAFVDVERIQYGFDRDSRRIWRRRTMTQLWDHAYNYDTLSQVTAEDRGDINSNHTAIAGIPEAGSRWDYDKTGNWAAYQTLEQGATDLDQTRVHDKGNRLTQISAAALMQTDRSGRMTQVPKSTDWSDALQIKWDAWSRIVEVRDGETILAAYAYDGLTRRITTTIDSTPRQTYYNDAWKPVEDGGYIYYWGARHRDDLVRRTDAETNSHIVLMDYFSPAALTDINGDVVERYDFSAFGQRTLLAANFDPLTTSSVNFTFAFQGQFEDPETGWLNYGYRYYLPNLGRFACKDPIMEQGSYNLYGIVSNNAVSRVDYLGLIEDPNLPRDPDLPSRDPKSPFGPMGPDGKGLRPMVPPRVVPPPNTGWWRCDAKAEAICKLQCLAQKKRFVKCAVRKDVIGIPPWLGSETITVMCDCCV